MPASSRSQKRLFLHSTGLAITPAEPAAEEVANARSIASAKEAVPALAIAPVEENVAASTSRPQRRLRWVRSPSLALASVEAAVIVTIANAEEAALCSPSRPHRRMLLRTSSCPRKRIPV